MTASQQSPQPDFNSIARPYRWLEYLTLGRSLERCRLHFLPRLSDRTHALVLGDGDGRFLARRPQRTPALQADAVDISAAMLALLRRRCPPHASLKTHPTDALTFLASPSKTNYDLVVTHFFLDCLTAPELTQLVASTAPRLQSNALWLVSDFRIPQGPMQLPANLLVRSLYLAFRLLTGLRVSRLPDHHADLTAAGFTLQTRKISLFGILTTELWQFKIGLRPSQTSPAPPPPRL